MGRTSEILFLNSEQICWGSLDDLFKKLGLNYRDINTQIKDSDLKLKKLRYKFLEAELVCGSKFQNFH